MSGKNITVRHVNRSLMAISIGKVIYRARGTKSSRSTWKRSRKSKIIFGNKKNRPESDDRKNKKKR